MSIDWAGGVLIPDPAIKKEYDVVLSNQGGDWNDFARNWTVAKSSIMRLMTELNLKVNAQILPELLPGRS